MTDSRKLPPKANRFPETYDKIAVPGLRKLAQWCAPLVTCEAYSFGEAIDLIWREAYRLGAGYLSDDDQEGLRDLLMNDLLEAIDKAEVEPPPGSLTPEQARKLWESLRHVT